MNGGTGRRLVCLLGMTAILVAGRWAACADGPSSSNRLSEVRARLQAVERAAQSEPDDPALTAEWATARLHLRKARFLDRATPHSVPTDRILAEIRLAEAALESIRNGRVPFMTGLREEGYYSDNDASFQPFLRYLPVRARRRDRLPLLVYLHGYVPTLNLVNWQDLPPALLDLAETEGYAVVAPFGRSNTDFQGIGEQDVLRAIVEMRGRYRVDDDRIVLVGYSMGGMGAWTIGAHYPHLFAGLVVISGRGDYYYWQGVTPGELPAYKRVLINTDFGYSLLPNLAHLPVYAIHAAADSLVPVAEPRHMIAALREVNPDVTYVELPDADHWIANEALSRPDLRTWLRRRRRSTPASFAYQTWHPQYRQAYWVSAAGLRRGHTPAVITARASEEFVALAARGVLRLDVCRSGMPAAVRHLPVVETGDFEIRFRPRRTPSPAEPCGPVKQAFLAPFVFVRASRSTEPEGSDPFRTAVQDWLRFAKAPPRTAFEEHIGREELARYNVFVFGEPEGSELIRRVLAQSPISITESDYVVGALRFPREGHGLYFVERSPWNPARLAVVQAGLAWGAGLPSNHKYDFLPDYIVYSEQTDPDGSNTALCAGFFDADWQVAPELMTLPQP